MNGHSFAPSYDNDRVECMWCEIPPFGEAVKEPCPASPDADYEEARDRIQASRSAKVHVVREDDVELDKMAEDFGHNNKEEV